MAAYIIDHAEPLVAGFAINDGSFDGPGGTISNTSLRLYGRGALEWGESVNENLVRLIENFAGATPPITPVSGQLWYQIKYYHRNTTTNTWYRYNLNLQSWEALTGVAAAPQISPAIGNYYYNTATSTLYRFDSAYKQAAAGWLSRAFSVSGAAPVAAPIQNMLVWDSVSSSWVAPTAGIITENSIAPLNPPPGTFWFDKTTGILRLWDMTTWQPIMTAGQPAAANVNMNAFSLTNLAAQTYPQVSSNSATTVGYVNLATNLPNTMATLTGQYVLRAGDAMTGAIAMSGFKVTGLGTPTATTDATTKTYVDTAISTASTTTAGAVPAILAAATGGKNGDIAATAGGIVYIKAGGVWKQVFPAVYN